MNQLLFKCTVAILCTFMQTATDAQPTAITQTPETRLVALPLSNKN